MSNVKVIYPHDPLCPAMNCIDSGCGDCCRCDLIAKVRQDMLAKCIAELNGLEAEMTNWSSEETNAVTDVVPDLTVGQWLWAQRGVGRSVQTLRGLQGKP